MTEARIITFLVILIVVEVAAGVLIAVVTPHVGRLPVVVGGLDRVGGIFIGSALALIAVWLLTAALLVLPASVVPWASAVHRSGYATSLAHAHPALRQRSARLRGALHLGSPEHDPRAGAASP